MSCILVLFVSVTEIVTLVTIMTLFPSERLHFQFQARPALLSWLNSMPGFGEDVDTWKVWIWPATHLGWEGDAEIVWSWELPNVPNWCRRRCCGRGCAFLPWTRQLGSSSKYFVYLLFKPAYILVASERGHTSSGTWSGRELALSRSFQKYLTLNCVLEHPGLYHGLCFVLVSSPYLLK